MATNEELKTIAAKAVEDEAFLAELKKDPAKAAASIGITLTEEQAEGIRKNAAEAEESGSRESKIAFIAIHAIVA
jgi:hypothetical protein